MKKSRKKGFLRRHAKKIGRAVFFLLILGAVAGAIFGLYRGGKSVLMSPHFALREVSVDCDESRLLLAGLSREAIVQEARLSLGTPLFSLSLAEIRERLEALNWVRDVRVRRDLPDRLYIAISFHEPRAILSVEKLYYVNAEGEVFKEVVGKDAKDYPLISGLDPKMLRTHPTQARAGILQALTLIDLLEGNEVLGPDEHVAEVRVDAVAMETNDIKRTTEDFYWDTTFTLSPYGTEVRLGNEPEFFSARLRALLRLKNERQDAFFQAGLIDLRFRGRLIVTPRSALTAQEPSELGHPIVKTSLFFRGRAIEGL